MRFMDGNIRIENFTELNEDELRELALSLGLSMSYKHLSVCRDYYKDNLPELDVTSDVLKLLDVMAKYTELVGTVPISDVRADDKEITDTLYDIYAKAKCLGIFKGEPLSLKEILGVCEKYFERIGVCAPKCLTNDSDALVIENEYGEKLAAFSAKNELTSRYGYVEESTTENGSTALENDTMFLLMSNTKDDDIETFFAKLSALCNNPEFKNCAKFIKKISTNGIFDTLMSLTRGLFIELDHLPFECEDENKLSLLTSPFENTYIVATTPDSATTAVALATAQGLPITFIAKKIAIDNILLHINGKTKLFENPFSSLSSKTFSLKIEKEAFLPTKHKNELKIKNGDETNPINGKIIALPHNTATALACNTEENGFCTGMSTVIDSVFALISKGVNRKEMGLTLSFGIPRNTDFSTSLSQTLAGVLGAYRAMIELCVPDTDSKIIESQAPYPFVFCSAFTKKAPTPISEQFVCEGNGVYLISFKRRSDTTPSGMPDFDNIRKMCDFVYSLIKDGKISSIRSFNGDARSAVDMMSTEKLVLDESLSLASLFAEGFIVESALDLSVTRIGTVSTKKSNDCEVTE